MCGRRLLMLVGLAVLATILVTPAPAKGPKRDEATILVKFVKPGADDSDRVQQDGDQAIGETKTKTVIVKLKNGASVEEKLAEYRARDDVDYAEENAIVSAALDPASDALFGNQWALTTIHALEAWSVAPGSYAAPDGPPIAIVDSGVDAAHPDLLGRVSTDLGANCASGVCVSDGAADDYGHGTHVAGIAAARADDGVGVAGLGFTSPIIPVKVLDSTGNGSYAAVAGGIIWAADQGARVINVSLGSTAYSQAVCDAVSYALDHGSVVVAAAGNYGVSTPFYPAACAGAIGVAATDSTDLRASFSETSYPNVFVSAPGVGIVSDYPGGSYLTDSGTSMSAPFVSALAQLLVAQNGARTVMDVKRMLAGTADKVGGVTYGNDPYATCVCTWNASYGYGRINAYRALTEASPAPAPDFALSAAAGTVNVQRGKTGTLGVSSSSSTGYTSSISLSVTGLPAGVTASFSPTTIAGVGNSTLTLTASTSAAYGSYPLTVKGTSGGLVRTYQVMLNIPTPDYTLKLSATSGSIIQSEKGTTVISLNNLWGFASTVALSVSGAPAGVTTARSSTSVSGTKISTLTITTTMSTQPGTYELTVTGTSGTLVRTAVYTLTVVLAVPDFKITSATILSSLRYGRVTTITYKLALTPKYGFTGPISLSVDGIPPDATVTWSPTTATANITSTALVYAYCYVKVPATAPIGTYTINLNGTGGGFTHTAVATIKIA